MKKKIKIFISIIIIIIWFTITIFISNPIGICTPTKCYYP